MPEYQSKIYLCARNNRSYTSQYREKTPEKMTIANNHAGTLAQPAYNSQFLSLLVSNPNEQEANCIAAWAILIRDYFGQETQSYVCLTTQNRQDTAWAPVSGDIAACQITLSLDGQDLTKDLSNKIREDFLEYGQRYSFATKNESAVLVFESDNPDEEVSRSDMVQVMELVKVSIVFHRRDITDELTTWKVNIIGVFHITPRGVSASIWTHPSNPTSFRDFVLLKSFTQVYKSLSSKPATRINEINSVTLFDLERMKQFNRPKPMKPVEKPHCLHELIGRHYSKFANTTALASTEEQFTYAELGQKSAVIAELLKCRGVVPGNIVGFCLTKSPLAIAVLVGILRSGAGYAPMDPLYPPGRIAQVVQKSEIGYVITEEHVRHKFEGLEVNLITLDDLKGAQPPVDWHKELHSDSSTPAYAMFTSGSTGVPKGVVHHHAAVSQSLIECIDAFDIDNHTRYLQFASLAFDASILEVFAPLVAGGCLCIPQGGDLESEMSELAVTDAWLTPSMVPHIRPEKLPSLRNLSVGGEPPSSEILSIWGKKVNFSNFYGLTEAGVWDTFKPAMGPDENPRNIGRGIGRVSCWIADPANIHNLRPIGAEGELLIQSPYLAHSYLNDAEKEKQAMLDPSSLRWASLIHEADSTRIYRTGDLAKFTSDGDVIFVGRETGFIKIRGLRVDLMEVEKTINKVLEKGRAAVVLFGAETNHAEIAAFCETEPHSQKSLADEMYPPLYQLLPEYMIPSIFIPTEKLPLTMSKKIDRQSLRIEISKMDQISLQSFRRGGVCNTTMDLPKENIIAISISNAIADMLEAKDLAYAQSLRGKDFSLIKAGLTSMQLVTLASVIKRKYRKTIEVKTLRQTKMTVCGIGDIVMNNSDAQDDTTMSRDLIEELKKFKSRLLLRKKTVFLTSITGFLGSQILRSLLENDEVGHIIGLVRADNLDRAREKVQQQAELGKWWQSSFNDKIEIWLGDLAQPKLGLQDDHWNRLFGNDNLKRLDGIIHNGARVNWMDTFEDLETVNVHSTTELLSGLSNMDRPCQLVYISGGYLSPNQESHDQIAKKLASASGYDQTKFLSELLVNEFNQHLDRQGSSAPMARTVIPGFIVGTRKEGIAHTEDFFWRLVYSIVRLRAVSERLGHLTVAGVDQVSELVSDVLFYPEKFATNPLTCLDGLGTSVICDIVSEKLNVPLRRVSHDYWMTMLRHDVEAEPNHPFAPVMEWFENNAWQFFGEPEIESSKALFPKSEIKSAIGKSVEYMKTINYISVKQDVAMTGDQNDIFTRSST